MKILAIGNSFSQDATRYLHQIAKADHFKLKVVNLYIGGCSLARHYKNINNDAKEYTLEYNGENTNFQVTIREALQSDEWDYVTLQQVSHTSTDFNTYQPYLTALSNYVKFHAPKAKQLIHQTWAYEDNSARLCKELGYAKQEDMFFDLKVAYEAAGKEIGAEMIPCGETFQNLLQAGIPSVHRDSFHAKLGIGRYALGLTWYEFLTGNSVQNNSFSEFDEPISEQDISIAKDCAHRAVTAYRG